MCLANAHESTCSFPIHCGNSIGQERFTIGGKVGVPFTDPLGSSSESRPYTVGPSVEFRLPAGFAVEASGIYHRIGQTYWYNDSSLFNSPGLVINRIRGNSWEFPVIGKYYFRGRQSRWAPYFGAGLAFCSVNSNCRIHRKWNESHSSGLELSPGLHFRMENRPDRRRGRSLACGPVRVLAGVRYTRWGSQGILNQKNEAGLFLGFAF